MNWIDILTYCMLQDASFQIWYDLFSSGLIPIQVSHWQRCIYSKCILYRVNIDITHHRYHESYDEYPICMLDNIRNMASIFSTTLVLWILHSPVLWLGSLHSHMCRIRNDCDESFHCRSLCFCSGLLTDVKDWVWMEKSDNMLCTWWEKKNKLFESKVAILKYCLISKVKGLCFGMAK